MRRHAELGLDDQQVLEMFRVMLLARKVDDRMFALNRQGRVPFVVGSSGHEGVQVASTVALDRGCDWILPYYRDMGVVLAWGVPLRDVFLATFARAADPMSGGRQLPNHWSDRRRRILSQSSTIGTQYPHAVGIAHGLVARRDPGVVVVYGGEGSTSEGDWHEAMNWVGIHRLPVVFVIENNRYAISVPARDEVAGRIADRAGGYGMPGVLVDGNQPLEVYGAVRDASRRAREGDGPTLVEAQTYRYYAHTSDDDDRLYRSREEVDEWRRNDPVVILRQYLIENRLLTESAERAMAHQLDEELAEAVRIAEAAAEPEDPFSHVYARVIEPGPAAAAVEEAGGHVDGVGGEEITLVAAVNRGLRAILDEHPDGVVFGEDVAGRKGGVFRATEGLTDGFGLERCFNTPLAESVIIGAAVGMAATGWRPIPEIQFADYIHPAFDQIVSEVARMHYRSKGAWPMPMVIRAPYGGGIHGALYHSQSIEAFYAHVPGLKVVIPSTPADAHGLLRSAFDDPDPVLFLEPKKLYRLARGPAAAAGHRVPLGRAALRRLGTDVTVIAYGAMAHFAVEAADLLADRGISVDVVDLRSIKPLDWPTIAASVERTNRALVVHEDNLFCGFGAEVAARIADEAFTSLDAPVRRYALPDIPAMPYAQALEDMVYPNPAGIADRAEELARW